MNRTNPTSTVAVGGTVSYHHPHQQQQHGQHGQHNHSRAIVDVASRTKRTVDINDFEILKVLGTGAYGKVINLLRNECFS